MTWEMMKQLLDEVGHTSFELYKSHYDGLRSTLSNVVSNSSTLFHSTLFAAHSPMWCATAAGSRHTTSMGRARPQLFRWSDALIVV
jgi:hypothetical protein